MTDKWSLSKDVSIGSSYVASLKSILMDNEEISFGTEIPDDYTPLSPSKDENYKKIQDLLSKIQTNLKQKSYKNIFVKGEIVNKISFQLSQEGDVEKWIKDIATTIKNLKKKELTDDDKNLLLAIENIIERDLNGSQRKLALVDPLCATLHY